MNILDALKELDVLNDDHWTADGAPRIDAVAAHTGDFKVNRKDIIEAAPHFDRDHPFEEEEEQSVPEAEEIVLPPKTEEYKPFHGGDAVIEFAKHLETVTAEDAPNFVEEVRQELVNSIRELEDAQVRARATKKMLDLAKNHANLVNPEISNSQAIRNYINSSNESRTRRAKNRDKVFKGITAKDLKDITGKSPLDAAMTLRKPPRGSLRPSRI